MAELEFLASDLRRELIDLADFAQTFLEGDSIGLLKQAASQVENAVTYGGPATMRVEDQRPIRTIPTTAYGGAEPLWAEVSWIWELSRVARSKHLRLVGKATSRIRVKRKAANLAEEVAMWRMEVGNEGAPGCHFHVQVRGELQDLPFPEWMSVPRLPGHLMTPPMAVEFAISELFQSKWTEASTVQRHSLQDWAGIQHKRFLSVFDWQRRRLTESPYVGSPLTALKHWKPDSQLVEEVAGRL
jgi:hypothetical protein